MRQLRNLMWFIFGLLISVGLFFAPYANAQMAPYPEVMGPFSPYPPQFNPYLPNPVSGAPSAISQATSAGVNVTQSGAAVVKTPAGIKIPVPTSQTANVAKGAIRQAARACFSSPIAAAACAATAAAAAAVADKSICFSTVIPGMPYVCKPDPATSPSGGGWIWASSGLTGTDPAALCVRAYTEVGGDNPSQYTYSVQMTTANDGLCKRTWNASGADATARGFTRLNSCAPNFTLQGGSCVYTGPALPPVPMTDSELDDTLQQKMDADFNNNRRLFDAMKKDEADHPNRDASLNPIKSDTPVSVNAPPVTSPERTVSETKTPKPDGSTDTKTVTEKTTVTPTTTGTTQGDVKTTYPSQTITTTTITNNITNNTTTETNTTTNLPAEPSPEAEQEDPCKGNPNRAGCALLGDPPPAEEIPKLDIPVSITPVVFASAAGCPAPITYELYGLRTIPFTPFCELATFLRGIFLMIASVTAAYIFMEAFKA